MANYRQAPRLIHNGNKFSSNKNMLIIPQDIALSMCNVLSGKSGNVTQLLLFFIGTMGDGSFRISEKWILKMTGMYKTSYINARKELAKMGWVTLEKGKIILNFDKIREDGNKYIQNLDGENNDDCEELGSCDNTSNEILGSSDNTSNEIEVTSQKIEYTSDTNRVHINNKLSTNDLSYNKDIYNNKEYNIYYDNTNNEIKISRIEDLAYILDMYSLKEEDVCNIIKDNKIDDPDDFVNLWSEMTRDLNIVEPKKRLTTNIQDVISDYFKFHSYNKFKVRDEFKISDISWFVSEDKEKSIRNWYNKRGRTQSSIDMRNEDEANILRKISDGGNLFFAWYFKRNFGRG